MLLMVLVKPVKVLLVWPILMKRAARVLLLKVQLQTSKATFNDEYLEFLSLRGTGINAVQDILERYPNTSFSVRSQNHKNDANTRNEALI